MGCNNSAEKRITPQPDPEPITDNNNINDEEANYEEEVPNAEEQDEYPNSLSAPSEDTYQIIEPPSAFPPQPKGISETKSFFSSKEKPTIFEYKFKEHIGHGAQSDVFLTVNIETGQYYAAKVYDQNYLCRNSIGDAERPIEKFAQEVQIMSTVSQRNCLNLIELLQDEFTNTIILILPYADDGALSSYSYKADPCPEDKAKQYFFQIGLGLRHIHSMNIIHRDIKPDNVLKFKDGHVVIADFSVSKILEAPEGDELLDDTDGTPAFYSPEECRGDPYYGKPADVWAYGMTLYVMIYGKLPFFDPDDGGVFFSQFFSISQKIIEDDFPYPDSIPISNDLRDLFSHLLDKDAKTRYTIEEALNHKWFAECLEEYLKEQEQEEEAN